RRSMPPAVPPRPPRRPARPSRSVLRRRRIAAVAGIAVLAGGLAWGATAVLGGDAAGGRIALAPSYVAAWQRQDYRAMHRLLTPELRRRVTLRDFAGLHRGLLSTATATGAPVADADAARVQGDAVRIPLRVPTRAFGTVRAAVTLPVSLDG